TSTLVADRALAREGASRVAVAAVHAALVHAALVSCAGCGLGAHGAQALVERGERADDLVTAEEGRIGVHEAEPLGGPAAWRPRVERGRPLAPRDSDRDRAGEDRERNDVEPAGARVHRLLADREDFGGHVERRDAASAIDRDGAGSFA